MHLTISRAALDEMRRAAAASPCAEICGLLLGRERVVETILPCANVAPDPGNSFEIDPAALVAVHRAARNGGPALLGHYHSHPSGDANPSVRDAAAAEAGSYWIIIGQGKTRCWLAATGGRFIPVALADPDNR
jgi:proteasome lid subunit RPN8/RPN11